MVRLSKALLKKGWRGFGWRVPSGRWWAARWATVLVLTLLLAGCAGLRPADEYPRKPSFALPEPEQTRLGQWFAAEAEARPKESGFFLLPNPREAFLMRVALAEAAECTLDVQSYLIRSDETGNLLLEAFARAADRGVRVRLLVDDFGLFGEDLDILALDAHPNIEVRVYNPFTSRIRSLQIMELLFHLKRLNRRMHNKSFIADNAMVIMGGRNLADEYFQAKGDYGFRDLDVFGTGPVAGEVSKHFDAYWNSASVYPASTFLPSLTDLGTWIRVREKLRRHRERMESSELSVDLAELEAFQGLLVRHLPLTWAPADVIADTPEKGRRLTRGDPDVPASALKALADRACDEMLLVSPYFVLRSGGIAFIENLRDRGVHVRVLTNSLASTDVPAAHAFYALTREDLLRLGVELHELKTVPERRRLRNWFGGRPSRYGLHTKMYVFDRREVVIGSFNFDPRSAFLNTEIYLVIHSEELAGKAASYFDNAARPANNYEVKLEPGEAGSVSTSRRLVWITEKDGREIRYNEEPGVSFGRRLVASLLALLPIKRNL